MPPLTDRYLNRERDFKRQRQSELSYLLMQAVARRLEAKQWTVQQLADRMGQEPQQIRRWMNGTSDLSLSTIAAFEDALEAPLVTIDDDHSLVFERRPMGNS